MQPELHDLLRSWRRIADGYSPKRLLLGETYVFDLADLASFYGQGDELHLAFNMPFLHTPFDVGVLRAIVEETEARIGPDHWPVWTLSSHDISRFPSRWCAGDPRKIRCALLLLFGLRGTPVLYYGDEIGMPDTPIPREELRDPVGKRFWPASAGRDPARTPMPWSAAPGAGFTREGVRPWLRLGDASACNVAAQRSDPGSVLHLCRDLIALRRSTALANGRFVPLGSPPGTWAWQRGDDHVVALNLGDETATLEQARGRIVIATERGRDGERVGEALRLAPWQGVIVERRRERSHLRG
jgi:alpha-glucosidase